MPDHRKHRGAHPEDKELFSLTAAAELRAAVSDLVWLLSRDYRRESSIKLVGDRYSLKQRQRIALGRAACSAQEQAARLSRKIKDVTGRTLFIDGYNLLTTIESALGGGLVLGCCDSSLRDLAGLGGTYRKVEETLPALELIAREVQALGVARCVFYLDKPVSNSGRLKLFIARAGLERHLDWQVELHSNVDKLLAAADGVVVSSDSVILDRCACWFNLGRIIIESRCPAAWMMDLGKPASGADQGG